MIDALILAFIMIVCWVAGYFYATYALVRKINKISSEVKSKIEQSAKDNDSDTITRDGIMLEHEIINDVHYFFDKQDHSFVCQGMSLEEAATSFNSRISGFIGCFKHNVEDQHYCFIDGNVVITDQSTKV